MGDATCADDAALTTEADRLHQRVEVIGAPSDVVCDASKMRGTGPDWPNQQADIARPRGTDTNEHNGDFHGDQRAARTPQ